MCGLVRASQLLLMLLWPGWQKGQRIRGLFVRENGGFPQNDLVQEEFTISYRNRGVPRVWWRLELGGSDVSSSGWKFGKKTEFFARDTVRLEKAIGSKGKQPCKRTASET